MGHVESRQKPRKRQSQCTTSRVNNQRQPPDLKTNHENRKERKEGQVARARAVESHQEPEPKRASWMVIIIEQQV